jgi:hypothetical protein
MNFYFLLPHKFHVLYWILTQFICVTHKPQSSNETSFFTFDFVFFLNYLENANDDASVENSLIAHSFYKRRGSFLYFPEAISSRFWIRFGVEKLLFRSN